MWNKYYTLKIPGPNTNRHIHIHKCLHCAEIEPAISRLRLIYKFLSQIGRYTIKGVHHLVAYYVIQIFSSKTITVLKISPKTWTMK
jgi:hypothetical protein